MTGFSFLADRRSPASWIGRGQKVRRHPGHLSTQPSTPTSWPGATKYLTHLTRAAARYPMLGKLYRPLHHEGAR